MSGVPARFLGASANRALGWVVIGLVVGIPIGVALSPSIAPLLRFSPSGSPPAYPLWCSDPNPISGWHYSVTYDPSNGAITSFTGTNGNGTPIPGPGQLTMNMSSYSNQTLIHSMYCYAEQGHSGAFPFHVDLTTNEVVWG